MKWLGVRAPIVRGSVNESAGQGGDARKSSHGPTLYVIEAFVSD